MERGQAEQRELSLARYNSAQLPANEEQGALLL
jgi:hypothetical protein